MILHRTILKELLINLAVIVFSLSVILFMEKFVKLSTLFMGKGADLVDILKIFIYLQPSIFLLSIPMAILIAVFLTYGRMAADSEIVVFKGSGMSFMGISKPAFTLSVSCVLVLLFISLYLLPRSMQSFKHTLYETMVKKASMTFEAETFSDVFKGTMIFIKEIPSQDVFRGIFVYKDTDTSVGQHVVIVAEQGTISTNPAEGLIKLNMNNGLIHTYKEGSSTDIRFGGYDFMLTSGIETMDKIKPQAINTEDLWKNRKDNTLWALELNRRFALPFACVIFGVLGTALSNKIGKIGRLGGFSLSLFILMLYYVLLITGEVLTKSGKISPALGGWIPNIVFSFITVIFFYIAHKDKPIRKF